MRWGQAKEEEQPYQENKDHDTDDVNTKANDGDRDIRLWLHEIPFAALVFMHT